MLTFSDSPSIELLQWLARGSLKQNLLRAVRLWVWLRFLYGDDDCPQWENTTRDELPIVFTFSEWRSCFFTASHPSGEDVPLVHDLRCCCQYTAAEWLFDGSFDMTKADWMKSLQHHDSLPDNLEELLRSRLFGVTRRSLNEDLRILYKLGWVQRSGKKYARVTEFPHYPSPKVAGTPSGILQPDLAAIAGNLSQILNGYQRFFLHVEYIVPRHAVDRVDDWQAQLRQIWEGAPTPPVHLVYQSGTDGLDYPLVVYPVCVYYVQRAAYLCAWGQVPNEGGLDWRNYRLDRIYQLEALTWNDESIPSDLKQAYKTNQLPTPDEIQERMGEAWGFDFYRPAQLLLLRFDQSFAKGYINNSVRHETFQAVTYTQARQLIQQSAPSAQRHQLLKVLQERSPQDSYYTAYGREADINLMLRLRAWRPKMEVLLPWDLRQQVAEEVAQEQRLYFS
jgi:CRISPR-associated protein (TIGR03985 family)